jgi:hypothetical protein
LASCSTLRSCALTRRLGEDVLRLRDGSLRALLECGAPTAIPGALLDVLATLRYPTQIAIQARRPYITEDMPAPVRLRASHAILMSRLAGRDTAFLLRTLVTVPWDAEESGDAVASLNARVGGVEERLDRAHLDPRRLSGRELDATAVLDVVQEGRCEVRVGGRLARTLIVTRLPEQLGADGLDALDCDHDLSIHLTPTSGADHLELSAYAALWTETRCALDVATERAEALLAAQGMRVRRPYLQAEPALVSAMPLCLDLAGARRALTVDQVRSSGAPAAAPRSDERALLYGIDPGSRQPLMLDRFALANANAVVLGDPEARSRVLFLELARARLAGWHVHLIAAAGAHEGAFAALGGRLVTPAAFDAFSVPAQPGGLESRIRVLLAVIELMAGGLTPAATAAVEDAIAFTYAAHGFSYEGDNAGLIPPALDEIRSALLRRGTTVSGSSQAEIDTVAARLERYTAAAGDGCWSPGRNGRRDR